MWLPHIVELDVDDELDELDGLVVTATNSVPALKDLVL